MNYKTITYSLGNGGITHSLRFWADAAGKAYGPQERSKLIGGIAGQMRQLEGALAELDKEGWELVSVSVWTAFPATRHGCAVLKKANDRNV